VSSVVTVEELCRSKKKGVKFCSRGVRVPHGVPHERFTLFQSMRQAHT
jgi:hypothetical protein